MSERKAAVHPTRFAGFLVSERKSAPRFQSSFSRTILRLVALLVLISVAYLVLANLALHSLLRKLDQTAMKVRWVYAYTLTPGTAIVTELRVSERTGRPWTLKADRIELRLTALDLLLRHGRVKRVRIMGATFAVGPTIAGVERNDSPLRHRSLLYAGLVLTGPEPKGTLRVDRLTASLRKISLEDDVLSGSIALDVQGLLLSSEALGFNAAKARLQDTTFQRGSSTWATALRAEVRAKKSRLPFGPGDRAEGPFELEGGALPSKASGLLTAHPISFTGQLVFTGGRFDAGSAVTFETEAPVRLSLVSGAFLKSGFTARVAVSEDGKRGATLLAPVLFPSDSAEPSFELQGLSLHLGPARAAQVAGGQMDEIQAQLEVRKSVLRIGDQQLASPMQANFTLKVAIDEADNFALGAGAVTLSDVVAEPPTSSDPASMLASIKLLPGIVVPSGSLQLNAELAVSGTQLRSLFQIAGAPGPARWMLSRFRDEPFESQALIRWTPRELSLREVELESGKLRLRGMFHQMDSERRGVFLLSVGPQALGIHLESSQTSFVWGADRDWMEGQGKELTTR